MFRHIRNSLRRSNNAVDPTANVLVMARITNRRLLIAILLAIFIVGLTMYSAIRRGMDHAVMIGPGDQTAIAISLSDSIYHVRLGYVGLKNVFDTIQGYWNRDASGWANLEKLKVNFHDAELLNAGIRVAASLGPQTSGYLSDGSLIVTQNDGKGAVDYVTIAFQLFGTQVQSLFYLYFALVGLSALIFILTFRDNIYALAVLLCTLAGYYIQLHLHIFDLAAVPTYFGMRHGSTVCLVAMWQFVFLVLLARKPTPWVVLGAVVQLAILILAWRLRWAAIWVFGFVVLVALVPALRHLCLPQLKLLHFRWSDFANSVVIAAKSTIPFAEHALRWPVVLLLAGLLGSSLYDRASLHPVYFTDDVMPERGLWNAAYLGLATYDPGVLNPRVAKALEARGVSEELGWWAARDHMDRTRLIPWDGKLDLSQPAPGLKSEWAGIGIRAALQDRMVRGSFTDAVKKHPFRVLMIYLVRKPVDVMSSLIAPFTRGITWLVLSLLFGAGIGALVMRFGRQDDVRTPRDMILLSGGVVLAATVPSLWAYPTVSAMGDSVLLLAAFASITIAMGTATTLIHRRAGGEKKSDLIESGREAKEGMKQRRG
jgi:hypothetical protein